MEFREARITKKGHALLAKMHAGEPLKIARVHCGDGVYDGDEWDLNDLINPKLEGSIISATPMPREQYTTFHLRFTNEPVEEFFMLREVGIFALDPDEGEVLYAYAQAGDRANFIEAYNGQWYTEDELFFNAYTASVANIDAKIERTADAVGIRYDNSKSRLKADNVQNAIDEIVGTYATKQDVFRVIEMSTAETPSPGTRLHMKVLSSVPNWVTPVYDQLPEAAGIQPAMLQIEGIGEVEGYLALDDGSMKRMVLQTT